MIKVKVKYNNINDKLKKIDVSNQRGLLNKTFLLKLDTLNFFEKKMTENWYRKISLNRSSIRECHRVTLNL